MSRRTLPLVVVLLCLAACQGDDGGQQAAPATTTVAPTTTTRPDPAEEGCQSFRDDPGRAHELLLISRDERIVEAAKLLEESELQGLTGQMITAVREIIRACTAAGYLP